MHEAYIYAGEGHNGKLHVTLSYCSFSLVLLEATRPVYYVVHRHDMYILLWK